MGKMDEYINREAALEICQKEYEERLRMGDYCGDTVAWSIGGAIKGLPAEDVAPVVHGRWVHDPASSYRVNIWFCSACNGEATRKYNHCPSCGAKMEEAR